MLNELIVWTFVSSSKGGLVLPPTPPLCPLIARPTEHRKNFNLHLKVKKSLYRMGGPRKTQTISASKNHGDYGFIYFFIFSFNICAKRAILGALKVKESIQESQRELKIGPRYPQDHPKYLKNWPGSIQPPKPVGWYSSLGPIVGLSWPLQGRTFEENIFNLKLVSSI